MSMQVWVGTSQATHWPNFLAQWTGTGKVAAYLTETAQMVDTHGAPVPLDELYLHHLVRVSRCLTQEFPSVYRVAHECA